MLALSGGSQVSPNTLRTKIIKSRENKDKKRPPSDPAALPLAPLPKYK